MRWLLVFTILLLICSVVPVLANEPVGALAEPAGFIPPTSEEEEVAAAQVPDAGDVSSAIADAEREEVEQQEWLASPEAKDQREGSQFVFGDLAASESEELLRAVFGRQLDALNGDPSRFLSDAQLIRDLPDAGALVKDEGESSLLESPVPVRTEDEGGQLAKVDLTLEATADGYETDNALTELRVPDSADGAIEVGDEGFEIAQAGAADSPARQFGEKNVFYPEVLTDTDLMVAGTSFGVELFNLLRSKESPEDFRFEIEVPAGAELRSDGQGGAEVVREGQTLTRVPRPWALDAQETEVPVQMEVAGSSVVLHVAHREGDYAYPLLVDPIIEDWVNASWYNGQNTAALTNGAWQWTANHASILHDVCCWEGHVGLLSIVQDASYGPEKYGQWSYSTGNEKTYITHAWLLPFKRADNGCGSAQPHDYTGLWNPDGNWIPVLSNQAKTKGTASFDGYGKALVLGLGSGPVGVSLGCDRILYAGGAAIWLGDDWGPGITSAGVPSGSWFGDKATTNVSVSAWDEGLGVQFVKLLNEGKGVIAEERPNNCTGLYGSRCPTSHNSSFNGVTGKSKVTGDSFGEGIRNSSVTVSDPLGRVAEKFFTTKVDNSPPEVALSGQLAKATGEVVSFTDGEKPVSDGKDQLSLPVYDLTIQAKDGVWEATNDKDKRSGVKDIEVWLGDDELEVPWQPLPSCPLSSCEMEKTYRLDLTEIDTSGSHKLKVIAKDFVGEQKVREIEFEYFPATGMKDEYVMHHFPLPNGQGDEAEEEHPVRPELAVNVMNGNLVYRERDIDVEGTAQVDLEVERYYNSMLPDSENTEWGVGWTLAETPSLKPLDTGGSPAPDEAQLIDSTGTFEDGIELPTMANEGKFDSDLRDTIIKGESGGYELVDETGESATSVVFDATGQAEARLTDGYAKVDFAYEGGDLSEIEVEDPSTFAADPSELEIPKAELVDTPVYASAFGALGSDNDLGLKAPSDVAINAWNNIWVVDKGNNRIKRFDSNYELKAKVGSLGTGNGQFNRPTAIALAANGDVLVTDSGNNRVQRFSLEGAYLSKFGSKGSGNGQFAGSGPEGIALDASGNIWVSDTYGGRLQKFNSAGTFVKAVSSKGSGSGQLGEPTGLDVDAAGNVWVADSQNNRVSVFSNEGVFLSQFGSYGTGNGQFNRPDEVEIDKFGNVWVGDQGNNRVQRFDLAAQYKDKFGSPGSGPGQFSFTQPMGIVADPRGYLWIADSNNNRVQRWLAPIDKPTYASSFGANGSGDGQFKSPADIAVDSFGNLWVADKSNNRIEKFDPTGKFIAQYGALGSGNGQFNRPSSIAVDRDGNILVADSNNHRIQKLNPAGEFISKFGALGSGNGKFNKPEEVVADFKGNIWVADVFNGRVQKFDEEGKFLKVVDSGQLYEPIGIGVDGGGNVWVADREKNRVSVFDPEGAFKSNVGSAGPGNGQFNKPDAVEIDNRGNVWVADLLNNRVQRFDVAGQYQGQFGAPGTGPGQFGLDFPSGIATDREGHLWVTDVLNHRIQQWLTANYAPAQAAQLDLTDGDASVEVETPGGLVSSVTGNAAGEHDYEHEGEFLVSHDGPDGETEYDYDEGRLSQITLPNGTWAEIDYEATYGRVLEVRVSVEGAAVKTTEFEYTDQPARSTKVIPSDAPHVVYDIGDDGSVFKWWNVKKPPELDLGGALYDNREIDGFFWGGTRLLEARAESEEGIASIKIIANGNTLVDEQPCPKPQVIECLKENSEWVTESDLHAPGHLQLEVVATDRMGESTSERFWVDVPKPTPLAPGTPVQPRFRDIARFREDYGLEVVFPVANETELNERILDLIKAWNEPNTSAGQVARASMDRWGVPLRPADVAELEYREWYIEQNGPKIQQWGEDNHANTYAGYWVDHRQGGIMRVGFTSSQASTVSDLRQAGSFVATDRIGEFTSAPSHPISELVSLQAAIGIDDASHGALFGLITKAGIDVPNNLVTVGATNTSSVSSGLTGHYGGGIPISVYPDQFSAPTNGRWTDQGPVKGGQAIGVFTGKYDDKGNKIHRTCTSGPSAWEKLAKKQPNGEAIVANFVLTAGHCFEDGDNVVRFHSSSPGAATTAFGEQGSRRWQIHPNYKEFEADGEAIRLKASFDPSAKIIGRSPVSGVGQVEIGQTVCASLGTSEKVTCQPIKGVEIMPFYSGQEYSGPFWFVRTEIVNEPGDSGSPVVSRRTDEAVGVHIYGAPSLFTPLSAPPLPEKGPYPYEHPTRSQAPGLLNEPFMGDLNIVKE